MALTELERKRVEKAASKVIEARRLPHKIRPKLDLGFRLEGQSIEIRPDWRDPNETMESSVAKFTYVKRAKDWRVYWQRLHLVTCLEYTKVVIKT